MPYVAFGRKKAPLESVPEGRCQRLARGQIPVSKGGRNEHLVVGPGPNLYVVL